jgi:hypothetical protein
MCGYIRQAFTTTLIHGYDSTWTRSITAMILMFQCVWKNGVSNQVERSNHSTRPAGIPASLSGNAAARPEVTAPDVQWHDFAPIISLASSYSNLIAIPQMTSVQTQFHYILFSAVRLERRRWHTHSMKANSCLHMPLTSLLLSAEPL